MLIQQHFPTEISVLIAFDFLIVLLGLSSFLLQDLIYQIKLTVSNMASFFILIYYFWIISSLFEVVDLKAWNSSYFGFSTLKMLKIIPKKIEPDCSYKYCLISDTQYFYHIVTQWNTLLEHIWKLHFCYYKVSDLKIWRLNVLSVTSYSITLLLNKIVIFLYFIFSTS